MSDSPTTESPTSLNSQNFSGSDDDILDNFAEGPQPGDPPPLDDTHDDGTPMGLGGEQGKQSEPASTTLEADIANDKKPGDDTVPPEEPAKSEPVADEGDEVVEAEAETTDTEEPEYPDVLLQMAGYQDAKAAKDDGFGTPEALHAYVRGRGQLLAPERSGPLYGRPKEETLPPVEDTSEPEIKPFEIPADKMEYVDDDLKAVLNDMNEHYQKEVKELRSSVAQQQRPEVDEVSQFDTAVQNLGDQWQDVFGSGDGAEMASRADRGDLKAATTFKNRDELFDEVQSLRQRSEAKGLAPMALQQEIQYALMQRHPDKFQQELSPTPERKSRGISRPTQRKTPPKTQNDKTLAAVNRMLAKKGKTKLTADPEDGFDGEL